MAAAAPPPTLVQPHPLVFRPHPNVILDQFARETRSHVRSAWDELTKLGAYGSATGECTLTRAILRIPHRWEPTHRAFSNVPAARRVELATVALRVVDAWKADHEVPLTPRQSWVLGVTEVGWRALLEAAVSDVLSHELAALTRLLQAMRFPFVQGTWAVELNVRSDTLGCDVVIHYRRGTAHARTFRSVIEAAMAWLADQVRASARG